MPGLPIDPDDDIVDVNKLFGDAKDAKAGASPRPIAPGGESYEMEGTETDEPEPWSRAPIAAPRRPAQPKPNPEPKTQIPRVSRDAEPSPSEDDEEATVDEVWTRWGEWGPTVIQLAIGFAVVLVLSYFVGGWPGFLVFVLGIAVLVGLSYPIAVTLERPMRMTPELAVKDFYGAASHHFPHYRRMWLLLSTEGRESAEFNSFATFRSYWKHRLTKLRGSSVKAITPLAFAIAEFDADKSAGQTAVIAKYILTVRPRGDGGPVLDEVKIATSLVRGSDKMWYLNRGTL